MSVVKTRSFSIYLLKDDFNAQNALKDGTNLEPGIEANNLPENSILHILDNNPKPPWWAGYFGIGKPLNQVSKGALIFVPAGGRWFSLAEVVAFGTVVKGRIKY